MSQSNEPSPDLLPDEPDDDLDTEERDEQEGSAATTQPGISLGFLQHADWRAVLLGTLKWSPVIVAIAIGSFIMGGSLANKLQKKSFEAETILKYQATGEESRYIDQKTTILTLKDTVKIRENLVDLRDRLGLPDELDVIGKALDIRVQKNTTLLVIAAKWTSARTAAEMANNMREIFLEQYSAKRVTDIRRQQSDLQMRLELVRADLRRRDRERQEFTTRNRIVDIDKQARALLEEFNNYGVLLEQAQAEKQTIEEQSRKLDQAINDLKRRVTSESKNMASLENLADVNTRIERIRDTIREDREVRMNQAELEFRQQEMERYKRLYDKGLVAELEYKRRVKEYDKQRILTQDTEKTARLRAERERLQEQIIPRESGTAPSAPILAEMLLRSFEIQLDKIAIDRKVLSLQEARDRVKVQLDRMPILQQQYDALQRNIASRETERRQLEERIAARQRDLDSRLADFTVVSEAEVDVEAEMNAQKSGILRPVIGVMGTLVGLLVVAALQLLDNKIRSPRDASLRLKPLPLVGALPPHRRLPRRVSSPFVPATDGRFAERLTVTARRLRSLFPGRGARILVVAPTDGEGAGTVARNLGAALGRQGERVVLVDARPDAPPDSLQLFPNATPPLLGQAIAGNDGASASEVALPTTEPGLKAIVRGEEPVSPDALGSVRMRRLLDSLSEQNDVVLVVTAPVLSRIEAELIAGFTDGALLVLRSGKSQPGKVRRAIEKLNAVGPPVAGVVLNRVGFPRIHWE
ncbi:MAG: hypothetical protein OHK0029_12400 [Armatimonadaceae bacterium]